MKKILTAIAVVFLFAFTASFCNANKDESKQPVKEQPTKYTIKTWEGKTITSFDAYLINNDGELKYKAHYAIGNNKILTGDPENNGLYRLKIKNKEDGWVALLLDKDDNIKEISVDIDNNSVYEEIYNCREPKNSQLCQDINKEVIYWKSIINWHQRIEDIRKKKLDH